MIVFDLRCAQAHVFEAWFQSGTAFEEQRERAMIVCPVCGDGNVVKAAMAPAIPTKRGADARSIDAAGTGDDRAALIAAMRAAQAEILKTSTWVGRAFPERVRAMHAEQEPVTPIHGEATPAEAEALIDDGIAVAPLPFPIVPPKALN